MSTEHTPGPWRVSVNGNDVENAEGAGVCALYADETEAANARLIAAAPKMFDQLVYVHAFLEGYSESESPGALRLSKTIGCVLAEAKPELYGNYLESDETTKGTK